MSGCTFPTGHLVGFFSSDAERIRTVAAFIAAGIAADETCLVIVTADSGIALRTELRRLGFDTESLTARYQYIELDARTLLSQFLDDNRCDRQRFHRLLDTLMRQALSRGQPVRAHGEMVSVLVRDGMAEAALQLEELWNEFSREHRFTILCSYSMAAVDDVRDTPRFGERLRALHSHVVS